MIVPQRFIDDPLLQVAYKGLFWTQQLNLKATCPGIIIWCRFAAETSHEKTSWMKRKKERFCSSWAALISFLMISFLHFSPHHLPPFIPIQSSCSHLVYRSFVWKVQKWESTPINSFHNLCQPSNGQKGRTKGGDSIHPSGAFLSPSHNDIVEQRKKERMKLSYTFVPQKPIGQKVQKRTRLLLHSSLNSFILTCFVKRTTKRGKKIPLSFSHPFSSIISNFRPYVLLPWLFHIWTLWHGDWRSIYGPEVLRWKGLLLATWSFN